MKNHCIKSACRVVDLGSIPYHEAAARQERTVARIRASDAPDVLYLLEHPHVITTGRNAGDGAILADRRTLASRGVEIARSDRGGDVTYHGPGQLVGYPVLHLEPARRSIRGYVSDLEEVLIRTLSDFGVRAGRHEAYRGVWTDGRKIASIGIRISRWVTCHGFALNVNTDLSYFSLIRPCGIDGCEMTSMERVLGTRPAMDRVKKSVTRHFCDVFDRRVELDNGRTAGQASREVRPGA